ncbi:MAG: hypothetical protein ACTSRS_15500 [Candidatus Helarchaeota archaeon]
MSGKIELGQIKKVGIASLDSKQRKICEIPLFLFSKDLKKLLPKDYDQQVQLYYRQLSQWLDSINEQIGSINRIYVESITHKDAAARDQLQKFFRNSELIMALFDKLFASGAHLEQTENEDLVLEYFAWLNDATSPSALEIDKHYLMETRKERANYISRVINASLKANEIGLLFLTPEILPHLQYPKDIEVIKFRPPIYDDLMKIYRQVFQNTGVSS